ncbi:MAG: PAS domain-containing protein, partial [Proteobacteria bacterium]|nr:PAS domain-containing protein [Pseudomonadota bacterium]
MAESPVQLASVKSSDRGTEMFAMMEACPVNVLACDRSFTITYMNPKSKETLTKLQSLLPVTVDKVVGSNIDIFHKNPSHQRRMLADDRNLPHKATISLGNEQLELNLDAVRDDAGKMSGVLVTWAIVTEQNLKVAEMDGRLAAISKAQAIIEFGLDGIVQDANENFLKTLGYTLDEVKGKHHSMFCDPTYVKSVDYKKFWAKLGAGEFEANEYQRFGKGGKEVWIQASYNPILDARGKAFKVIKYASDVSAQKLKDAQLAALSKAQAVIEFGTDGIVTAANDNFLNALNYRLEDIRGKHHSMFCDTEYTQSPRYKDFWTKLGKGEFQAGQFKRIGKGGKVVWIQASYNPVFDLSGEVFKVVKYASDITKAKNEELEIMETLAQTSVQLASASEELHVTATQMNKSAETTSTTANSTAAASEEV